MEENEQAVPEFVTADKLLDKETIESEKKTLFPALKSVENTPREKVIALIYRLLEKKVKLLEIERQTGINRASIYNLKTRIWWPQKEVRQLEILEKLENFEKNLKNSAPDLAKNGENLVENGKN